MEIVFKKLVVSLTIVNDNPLLMIVNDDPKLTIVNDDPVNDRYRRNVASLTIVNEERRRDKTDLKGVGTYNWEVLKKISISFSSPTTFSFM